MTGLTDDMRALTARIDALLRERGVDPGRPAIGSARADDTEMLALALHASRLMLAMSESTLLGECRREKPFKPLRPIIDENGTFKWCCTHSPPHCS